MKLKRKCIYIIPIRDDTVGFTRVWPLPTRRASHHLNRARYLTCLMQSCDKKNNDAYSYLTAQVKRYLGISENIFPARVTGA